MQSEFPIFQYAVAALYTVFGLHDWLGRILNIVIYSFSALFTFLLARKLHGDHVVLLAAFFYSVVPLSYVFTRTFQPDSTMSLCLLVGVCFFWLWCEREDRSLLLASAVAIALAACIKPGSLFIGLPLLYLAHSKFGWALFRQFRLWLFTVLVLVPAVLWYAHAAHLWKEYGNSFFIAYLRLGYPGPTSQVWVFTPLPPGDALSDRNRHAGRSDPGGHRADGLAAALATAPLVGHRIRRVRRAVSAEQQRSRLLSTAASFPCHGLDGPRR